MGVCPDEGEIEMSFLVQKREIKLSIVFAPFIVDENKEYRLISFLEIV